MKLDFTGATTPNYIEGTIIIINHRLVFAVSRLYSNTLVLIIALKLDHTDPCLIGEESKVQRFSQDHLVVH